MRKKIIIFIDSFGWALDNVALKLKQHLDDEFDIDIFPTNDMSSEAVGLAMGTEADLVHYLWRGPLINSLQDSSLESYKYLFGGYDEFLQKIQKITISFTVFDHLFLDPGNIEKLRNCFNERCLKVRGYTVSSEKLASIYKTIDGIPSPFAVTQDGVDLSVFKPVNLHRLSEVGLKRPIRVGWVGNSAFGHWHEAGIKEDLKGFHSIIRPALSQLRVDGYAIEEHFADRQEGYIPHRDMPAYYSQIDVLLCASSSEGTPNPVLEAMACGVPVISTNVGIVSEVFGSRQMEYILDDRSIDRFKDLLVTLIKSPIHLKLISDENLKQIRSWDWKIKAETYRKFFKTLVA